MNGTICHKQVRQSGNSLVVNITKELNLMGIEAGDVVKITIEKP